MSDAKLAGVFAPLTTLTTPGPQDTHAEISSIKEQLNKELPAMRSELDRIGLALDNVHKQLGLVNINIGAKGADGDLHTMADRLKKRMTNVKVWVVGGLAVLLTAMLFHILRP
ncbi:MAG: hypothetical protein WA021_01480 [Minisyncoccia bacterium]